MSSSAQDMHGQLSHPPHEVSLTSNTSNSVCLGPHAGKSTDSGPTIDAQQESWASPTLSLGSPLVTITQAPSQDTSELKDSAVVQDFSEAAPSPPKGRARLRQPIIRKRASTQGCSPQAEELLHKKRGLATTHAEGSESKCVSLEVACDLNHGEVNLASPLRDFLFTNELSDTKDADSKRKKKQSKGKSALLCKNTVRCLRK